MQETIKRTKSEKERIGETVLFFGMLGIYVVPPLSGRGMGERYDGAALGEYLADDPRRVRHWWGQADADQKLYMVQRVMMDAQLVNIGTGWETRISDRWADMRPEIQDTWARMVGAACWARLEILRAATVPGVWGGGAA